MLQNYKELIYVEDVEDLTLGNIQVYRLHPYPKYMGCKCLPLKNINYKERVKFRHPSIFTSIKAKQVQQSVQVFFEYDYEPLSSVLDKRAENKWLFPEQEIWQIIKQLSNAMHFLQSKGIWHGNLSAQSIYFDDEYQVFRIYDNVLLNGDQQGLSHYPRNRPATRKAAQPEAEQGGHKEGSNKQLMEILLAPELLKQLARPDKPTHANMFKADIFSFGMLILQMGTLLPISECYSTTSLGLNLSRLNQYINVFAGRYSPHLLNFLQQLLEPDVNRRIDWNELNRLTVDGCYSGMMKASAVMIYQAIQKNEENKQLHLQDQIKQMQQVIKGESRKVQINTEQDARQQPQLAPEQDVLTKKQVLPAVKQQPQQPLQA